MNNKVKPHLDEIEITYKLPVDVTLALDEGDAQIRHMDSSRIDHSGSMIKLSRFQYEALRKQIYAGYNRR